MIQHSIMDGTPTFRLGDFIMSSLANDTASFIKGDTSEVSVPLRQVKFIGTDSEAFARAIKQAGDRFDADVKRHDHDVLRTH